MRRISISRSQGIWQAALYISMISLFVGVLYTRLAFADPPQGYSFLKYDQGLQKSQNDNKRIFVYFGRFGCGYCAKTNKETFSDPGLHDLFVRNYTLVYVDAESGDRINLPTGERITEMELGARLNVFATPVFVFLEPDGNLIFKAPGFKTVKDFIEIDRYIQDNYYKTKSFSEFLAEKK